MVIGLQSTGEARTADVVAERGELLEDYVSGPRVSCHSGISCIALPTPLPHPGQSPTLLPSSPPDLPDMLDLSVTAVCKAMLMHGPMQTRFVATYQGADGVALLLNPGSSALSCPHCPLKQLASCSDVECTACLLSMHVPHLPDCTAHASGFQPYKPSVAVVCEQICNGCLAALQT